MTLAPPTPLVGRPPAPGAAGSSFVELLRLMSPITGFPRRRRIVYWPDLLVVWGFWIAVFGMATLADHEDLLIPCFFYYSFALLPIHFLLRMTNGVARWRREGAWDDLMLAHYSGRQVMLALYTAPLLAVVIETAPGMIIAGYLYLWDAARHLSILGLARTDIYEVLATGLLLWLHIAGTVAALVATYDLALPRWGPRAAAVFAGLVAALYGFAGLCWFEFLLHHLPIGTALAASLGAEGLAALAALGVAWRVLRRSVSPE